VLVVLSNAWELFRAAPEEQNRFCTLLHALAAERARARAPRRFLSRSHVQPLVAAGRAPQARMTPRIVLGLALLLASCTRTVRACFAKALAGTAEALAGAAIDRGVATLSRSGAARSGAHRTRRRLVQPRVSRAGLDTSARAVRGYDIADGLPQKQPGCRPQSVRSSADTRHASRTRCTVAGASRKNHSSCPRSFLAARMACFKAKYAVAASTSGGSPTSLEE